MYLRRSTRKRNKPDLYYPGFSFQSSNRYPHIKPHIDTDKYSENTGGIPEDNKNRERGREREREREKNSSIEKNNYENRNNSNFSNSRKRKNSNYSYNEENRDRRQIYSNYYLTHYGSNSSHSRPVIRRKGFIRPLSNSSYSSAHLTNYTSSPASTVSVNSNSSLYYPIPKRKRVYYSPSDHHHYHSFDKIKNYSSYSHYSSRSSKTMSNSSSSSISTSHSRGSKRYTHSSYDDKDGHYRVVPNTEFTNRYIIKELLGQGTFGKVIRAYDKETKRECAIKIIRAIKKYRDASQIEIRVLKTIKDRDPNNLKNCIHLIDCFDYRRHICMVFELLDQSVFDFLKENEFHPFPIKHIQHFAYQLLISVEFIHSLKLIHTDLKPENIMIVNNKSVVVSSSDDKSKKKKKIKELCSTEIQLIDFGSATFEDEYHSSIVSTRHYRAPEIILNLGWSYPCDIWSIGCILIEFFTGTALFQTHDNLEHLAMMEKILGPIPDNLRVRNDFTKDIFLANGDLNYPNENTTADSKKYVKSIKPLNKIIPPTNKFNKLFLDLVEKLLTYNPKKRITAHEAKQHEFFKYNPDNENTN